MSLSRWICRIKYVLTICLRRVHYQRLGLAPLELCFHPNYFDLQNNTSKCPAERNALKVFYDSSKGGEWTESTNWMHPYISHCQWHGVKCNEDTNEDITIKLELPNNGLSGTLSKSISSLSSLQALDLSDNDIKVRHVCALLIPRAPSFAILTKILPFILGDNPIRDWHAFQS